MPEIAVATGDPVDESGIVQTTEPISAEKTPHLTGEVPEANRTLWRPAFTYAGLVVVPLIALVWIITVGNPLPTPIGKPGSIVSPVAGSEVVLRLPIFLTQVVLIIVIAHLMGGVARRLGQPRVVGEMLAGLALGPSLLGAVWPSAYGWLFPPGTVRFLNALSQVGLVLFMFLVGLELDPGHLRARGRQVLVIGHAGIALPMLGGGAMALLLYHDCATPLASFTVFALFVGCSMSVTAFPVLARILAEHELLSTKFGLTATACAAMSDVTAWGMLAVIVALGRRAGNVLTLFEHTILGLLVFLVVMFGVVRKLLAALWRRERASARRLSQEALAGVIVLILLSALATELLHLHAIFGAFVAGLVMPPDDALRSMIRSRLEDLLAVLLLPLFFAFTGLRTNIGLLSTGADWALTLGIIALAIAGKCGGTTIAARSMGINWRRAGALGVLMNSRGLIELVLLTIGLQEGIITSRLFTMMFLMAIVTTMMTVPLLKRFVPARAHVD